MVRKQNQRKLLEKAAFTFHGCLTNPMEGLVLGNGDMAAVVTVAQHEARFMLTKSDCYDARFENSHNAYTLTHDQLIQWENTYGFCWPTPVENDTPEPQWRENPQHFQVAYASPSFGDYMHGPNPKPMGTFILRHNGLYGVKIDGRLDISTGVLRLTYDFTEGTITISAFIGRKENTLHIRVTKTGNTPNLQCILEKYPDNSSIDIPVPIHAQLDERCAWMTQTIPAGCGVNEFKWCLAANYPSIQDHGFIRGSYRIWKKNKLDVLNYQSIRQSELIADQPFDCVVAAATSRQSCDPEASAKALAGFGSEPDFSAALQNQLAAMTDFWNRSGIWLEDEEAAKIWYRGIYSASVYITDNGTFPTVVNNIPLQDYSPWHGACVWNMNIQRWTVHAFVANHLEWIEAYTSKLEESRPTFEYFAKNNFGLDGIFPDFLTIPFVPPERAYVNNKWGRSLSMLGWILQPIWFYWEYTKDMEYLRTRGYPLLRDAAIFYAGFMKKYQREPGSDLFPSMHIMEGPGWMPQFKGNRNLFDDLVNFEQSFNRAIEAATILNVDPELRQQWNAAKQSLPKIRYDWDGRKGNIAFGYSDELGYTDYNSYYLSPYLQDLWKRKEDIPFPYETTALWMIYPFEYLMGDGTSPLEKAAAYRIRNMYDYTVHDNPRNECHPSVPYSALLRVDGQTWYEHTIRTIEESTLKSGEYAMFGYTQTQSDSGFAGRMPETYVHPIQYINDILLQTQGNVIRIFPALPKGKQASFSNLRARSGFFVSAETDGRIITTEIVSQLGGTCCIKIGTRKLLRYPEKAWEENGLLFFDTEHNQVYLLTMEER